MRIREVPPLTYFRFLNVGCGDATIIRSNTSYSLVDSHGIEDYSEYLPIDKKFKCVFITHQHRDHFDGLNFLYRNDYEIKYLIYNPYSRRLNDKSVTPEEWREFNKLKNGFVSRGTEIMTPFRQLSFNEPFISSGIVKYYILGPSRTVESLETRELHDACLIIKAVTPHRSCLFTGDASDSNLNQVFSTYSNYCNDILHVSHHGSINGADLEFIKGCDGQLAVISTDSGVFPSVPESKALRRYRDNFPSVHRTDTGGTLRVNF